MTTAPLGLLIPGFAALALFTVGDNGKHRNLESSVGSQCNAANTTEKLVGDYSVNEPHTFQPDNGGTPVSVRFRNKERNSEFWSARRVFSLRAQSTFRVRLCGRQTEEVSRFGFKVFLASDFEILEASFSGGGSDGPQQEQMAD